MRLFTKLESHFTFLRVGAFLLLLSILAVAFWIRCQGLPDLPEGQFTANDAYLYYWLSEMISENGSLPTRDMHRWVPVGRDLEQTLPLYSYITAYTHKLITPFFPDVSLYQVHIFAPVICFVLGMGVLCLYLYRAFGLGVAISVGLLLAFLPSGVERSAAGFSDRDSWCWLLGILAVTPYLWREQIHRPRYRFLCSAMSGFFVLIGGLSWEGFGVFVLAILCVELWRFLTSETEEYLLEYLLWVSMFVPWLYLISPAYRRGEGFATYLAALVLVPPLAVLGIRYLRACLTTEKINSKWKWPRTNPRTVSVLLLIGCLVSGIIYFFSQRDSFALSTVPLSQNQLMQTVTELVDPNYGYWVFRFGGVFLLGSIGLMISCMQLWGQKGAALFFSIGVFILTTFFRDFLTLVIDTRHIELLFFVSVGFIGVSGLYVAWQRKVLGQNETVYILMGAWFLLWIGLSRGARRYDFFVGMPLVFFVAVLLRSISTFVIDKRKVQGTLQPLLKVGITVACLAILLFWEPPGSTQADILAKRGVFTPIKMRQAIPGRDTLQGIALENTYHWMKTALSEREETVVSAAWSYGGQLNVLGGVKTIIDQDHFIQHRIHLHSRHVFCAQSEQEALKFLKAHGATHLLLTESEVFQPQFTSAVGSDENADRQFDLVPMLPLFSVDGSPKQRMIPSHGKTPVQFIDIDFDTPITVTARLKTGKNIPLPYIVFFGEGEIEQDRPAASTNGGIVHYFNAYTQRDIIYYVIPIGWNSLAVRLFFGELKSPHFIPVYPQKEFSTAKAKVWEIHYTNY